MVKWKFRSCPRCDGDIFIDRDLYGWFEQCIQCGYNHDLRKMVQLGKRDYIEKEKDSEIPTLSKG